MTRNEILKAHLNKIRDLKTEMKLIQDRWIAYNKHFNEWLQEELGVKDMQGELHLTEILKRWDDKSDQTPLS